MGVKAQLVSKDTVIPLQVPRLRASAAQHSARRPGSVHGASYHCARGRFILWVWKQHCFSLSLSLSLECVRTCTYVYIYVLYENAMSPFVITVFANLLAKHASARTQTHIHITHPQTTRTPPIARRV